MTWILPVCCTCARFHLRVPTLHLIYIYQFWGCSIFYYELNWKLQAAHFLQCRLHVELLRVCAWRGLTHLSGLTQSATPMSKLPFPAARCLARRRHAAPAERGCRPESRYQRHLYSQHNTSPANARYLGTNQQSPVYTNRGNQNQLTTIISHINIKHLHTVRVTTHIKTTAIHT